MTTPIVWKVWKVTLCKDGVETVYLVGGVTRREVELAVLEAEYDPREHILPAPATVGNATPFAYRKAIGCSTAVVEWHPDTPYKLYTLDTKTGAMR